MGKAMADRLQFAQQFRDFADQLESILANGNGEWPSERIRLLSKVGALFGTAVDAGCFHSLRYAPGLVETARTERQGGTDEGWSIYTLLIGRRGTNVLGRQGLSSDALDNLTDAGFCRRLVDILDSEDDADNNNIQTNERDVEVVWYADICSVLEIGRKRLQNAVSEWRTKGGDVNDPCLYATIRPFILKEWPKKAALFPESFSDFQRILEGCGVVE